MATKKKKSRGQQSADRGSPALLEYRWASLCDRNLFFFVCDVVLRSDFVRYVAKQALDEKTDYKKTTPVDLAKSNPGIGTRRLRQSSQELIEMFLSRAVDNFEVYLVEVIRLALHTQPRILADRKQELTLGHILKFDSIEALSRDIIEGKLNSLSYEGFGEVEEWCHNRGIPLLVPEGRKPDLVELIATRNIIVHGRGAVDERYRAAVPASKYALGQKRELIADDLIAAFGLLDAVTTITDAAIAGKFQLQTVNTGKELKIRSKKRWPDLKASEDQPTPKSGGISNGKSALVGDEQKPSARKH